MNSPGKRTPRHVKHLVARLSIACVLLAFVCLVLGYYTFRSSSILFGWHLLPGGELITSQTSSPVSTRTDHVDVYQDNETVWIDTYADPSNGSDDPHLYKIKVPEQITAEDVKVTWLDWKRQPVTDTHDEFYARVTITVNGATVFNEDEDFLDRAHRITGW